MVHDFWKVEPFNLNSEAESSRITSNSVLPFLCTLNIKSFWSSSPLNPSHDPFCNKMHRLLKMIFFRKKNFQEIFSGEACRRSDFTYMVTVHGNQRISFGVEEENSLTGQGFGRLTVNLENDVTGGVGEPEIAMCKAGMFLGHEEIDRDQNVRRVPRSQIGHG